MCLKNNYVTKGFFCNIKNVINSYSLIFINMNNVYSLMVPRYPCNGQ